jgi:hypothetical protein
VGLILRVGRRANRYRAADEHPGPFRRFDDHDHDSPGWPGKSRWRGGLSDHRLAQAGRVRPLPKGRLQSQSDLGGGSVATTADLAGADSSANDHRAPPTGGTERAAGDHDHHGTRRDHSAGLDDHDRAADDDHDDRTTVVNDHDRAPVIDDHDHHEATATAQQHDHDDSAQYDEHHRSAGVNHVDDP